MQNVYTDFIKYLQFLTPMEQLLEIDLFIKSLSNNKNNSRIHIITKRKQQITSTKKIKADDPDIYPILEVDSENEDTSELK